MIDPPMALNCTFCQQRHGHVGPQKSYLVAGSAAGPQWSSRGAYGTHAQDFTQDSEMGHGSPLRRLLGFRKQRTAAWVVDAASGIDCTFWQQQHDHFGPQKLFGCRGCPVPSGVSWGAHCTPAQDLTHDSEREPGSSLRRLFDF